MKKEEAVLDVILTIANDMLRAGMEVRSVEQDIEAMCAVCGMEEVQVFTITSSILVSAKGSDGSVYTQSRRIRDYETDFARLEQLNRLVGRVKRGGMACDDIKQQLGQIRADVKPRSAVREVLYQYGLYCSISFIFSLFFGGSLKDGIAACICAFFIRSAFYILVKAVDNRFLLYVISSAAGGVSAFFLYRIGGADSVSKVIIGNIMLLIPGLATVNACKDLVGGDMISGLLRLADALIIAAAVAIGFSMAFFVC